MEVNTTLSYPEVTLSNGENFTVKTDDGRELFVLFEDGQLTICNETIYYPESDEDGDDYGMGEIGYAHRNGSWEVKD